MSIKGNSTRYGALAIALHWTIAALIIIAIIAGLIAEDSNRDVLWPLRVHVVSGLLAGLLTLVRIGWAFVDVRPGPAPNTDGATGLVAKGIHILLYILPVGLLGSGVAMMVLSGAGEVLFFGAERNLPDFFDYLPRIPHGIGGKVIIAAVLLHVAGAFWHQFWLKDNVMNRIRANRAN